MSGVNVRKLRSLVWGLPGALALCLPATSAQAQTPAPAAAADKPAAPSSTTSADAGGSGSPALDALVAKMDAQEIGRAHV